MPLLTVALAVTPGGLRVQYTVANRGTATVLLFDRWWNPALDALDPDWMIVALVDTKAGLFRGLVLVPEGMLVAEPMVPYGRPLAPGEVSVTEVTVPLPLRVSMPYTETEDTETEGTRVAEVELQLGWCVLPPSDALPPASREPVRVQGELLRWMPYGTVADLQERVSAERTWLSLPALRTAPRERRP